MLYTDNTIKFGGNNYTEGFVTNIYGKESLIKNTYIKCVLYKTIICTQGYALYIGNGYFYIENGNLVIFPTEEVKD